MKRNSSEISRRLILENHNNRQKHLKIELVFVHGITEAKGKNTDDVSGSELPANKIETRH